MHDCTHQYNNMGEQEISIVPASIKSLPYMSFLNHHSSYNIGKFRGAEVNVHKTDGQNMTAIQLSTMEVLSSD